MKETGTKNPQAKLSDYNVQDYKTAFWNLDANQLIKETLSKKQGTLTSNGTLVIQTGTFTGRSPKDRYIVKDHVTENTVDWNPINQPISELSYRLLKSKIQTYFKGKDIYIKDAAAGQASAYRINLRLIAEQPWSAQFAHNMFIRLNEEQLLQHTPEWTILCAPGLLADPAKDGTRASNFSIINFTDKTIIIGGSGYTGEIKKGIFSVLNYHLPIKKQVLPMHCSANVGKDGDTTIYFGLSGTGKTTLSADANRALIGDDEHGWSDEGIFNFEGGCYAKCINLTKESEPTIYNAIKPGAILENIKFHEDTSRPDYTDTSITQNTRVSYPIHHIHNFYKKETAPQPKNIFFLTCDAFGVLPPISKLNPEQAMYYFMSGYTAKVAGTEAGVVEPTATFSACFGAPFMPLHPGTYAQMLGEKIKEHQVKIWLVNTGWTEGPYGQGHRIALSHTRSLIAAATSGALDAIAFENFDVFDLQIPTSCPDVPSTLLNPRNTWTDQEAYDKKRVKLAGLFNENFKQYENKVASPIKEAAPHEALSV